MQVVCVLGFLVDLFFLGGARLSLCHSLFMTTTLGKLHLSNLGTTYLFCTLYWLNLFIVIDTCFLLLYLWIFCFWLTYIFLIVIDHCEENLWYIVKCDSIPWLFTNSFCLIICYYTGSCLSYCYFCNDIRILFYPQLLYFFA